PGGNTSAPTRKFRFIANEQGIYCQMDLQIKHASTHSPVLTHAVPQVIVKRSAMYPQNIRVGNPTCLHSPKPASLQFDSQLLGSRYMSRRSQGFGPPRTALWTALLMIPLLVAAIGSTRSTAQSAPPASDRITINLSEGVPHFV